MSEPTRWLAPRTPERAALSKRMAFGSPHGSGLGLLGRRLALIAPSAEDVPSLQDGLYARRERPGVKLSTKRRLFLFARLSSNLASGRYGRVRECERVHRPKVSVCQLRPFPDERRP